MMMLPDDPASWSEEQWEAYLHQQERWLTRVMDYLFDFIRRVPPPEPGHAEAMRRWEEALAAYLQRRTGWKGGTNWQVLWMLWEPEEEDPEEAPGSLAEVAESWPRGLESLPVYRQASRLSREVLQWAEQVPGSEKDSSLVHFCTCVNQIGAYIARGHQFGYEKETLGGNLVCVRRALHAANLALKTLRELRGTPSLDEARYLEFYEAVYEMRNALGLYVQALRERMELGID